MTWNDLKWPKMTFLTHFRPTKWPQTYFFTPKPAFWTQIPLFSKTTLYNLSSPCSYYTCIFYEQNSHHHKVNTRRRDNPARNDGRKAVFDRTVGRNLSSLLYKTIYRTQLFHKNRIYFYLCCNRGSLHRDTLCRINDRIQALFRINHRISNPRFGYSSILSFCRGWNSLGLF